MSLLLTSISLEKIPSQTVEAPLLQPSPSVQAQNGQAESGQWKGMVGGTPFQDCTENRLSRVLGAELPPTPEPRLGCLCPQTSTVEGTVLI